MTSTGDEEIQTLDGLSTGRFLVTTASGSRHMVDLDARTTVRIGAEKAQWGPSGMGLGPVTPDGQAMHCSELNGAAVGQRMRAVSDHEWRVSSEVLTIERVDERWPRVR